MSLKKRNPNNIVFVVIIFYFVVSAILHFARLTFSWDVVIRGNFGEQLIPPYISGFCIITAIIIIFFITRLNRKTRKENEEKAVEEEDIDIINNQKN